MNRNNARPEQKHVAKIDRRQVLQWSGTLLGASLMTATCSATGLSATTPKSAAPQQNVIRRFYVDGRYGQIHMYRSTPAVAVQQPLMCFHPTAMAGDYFRDFMAHIGTDRVVLAMDTPGYGKSDRPSEPQPMNGLAGAAADALDALGYGAAGRGPVDTIGYHTGTYMALELAVSRPDLVRRLVLPGIPFFTAAESRERLESNMKPRTLEEYEASVQGIWKFWVTNRGEGMSAERGIEHFAANMLSGTASRWAYYAVFSYPAEERLPLVKQPVLIPNTFDGLEERSRQAGNLLPNSEIIELPDINKRPFANSADRLAKIARAFLDG